MSRGILLVNLGTPDSSRVADVRRYLNEFLMDPYVLDAPWPIRRLIVSAFILPFRPRRSAAAYASIWDAAGPGTGSPLLHYSAALQTATAAALDVPCELAMRYGKPSIAQALDALARAGVTELLLVPLYPQFADSTWTTTDVRVRKLAAPRMRVATLAPFYDRPDYIAAMTDLIRTHLPAAFDHLLFSYHGLPERHITRADPTGSHCLKAPDCCTTPSPAHATCYRHQCFRTSTLVAQALGLAPERWSVSFQSRLGRLPWLTPYTDQVLADLPTRDVRRLVVVCPAFVADNLETLEEIGMAGRETFLEAGGADLTLVPCLNDRRAWIDALVAWCQPGAA
ncbi:MAG: ferrochelatase [Pseudomonadales bacterium]|nr:ferrochelatase [Pseudomonadales bacterium]